MALSNFLADQFQKVSDRVKEAQRQSPYHQKVTLVAVSKGQEFSKLRAAYEWGQRDFGENYAQELVEKAQCFLSLGIPDVRWHFLGHLQTNKVKLIAPYLSCLHSLDSLKLAQEIDKRRGASPLECFLELNIDSAESKSGLLARDLVIVQKCIREIKLSCKNVQLVGAMAIPEPGSANPFRRLREIVEKLGTPEMKLLSMGMSGDFEEAILEGSTHVRVGTAFFGERDKK